jgi:hypothetical protein
MASMILCTTSPATTPIAAEIPKWMATVLTMLHSAGRVVVMNGMIGCADVDAIKAMKNTAVIVRDT